MVALEQKQKSVEKKGFFRKANNRHSRIGAFFYVSHLIWWIAAVNPITSSLKTINMALGFSVFLFHCITCYQAYYQYPKPISRLFTSYVTTSLGWQILVTIIVENFYFDYEFKGRELFLLLLLIFTSFIILFDLLTFKKLLSIILFTPKLGGKVARCWNMTSKIALILGNGILYLFGCYLIAKIWFLNSNSWFNYPDQYYVMSFSWHIFINYGLLVVLIMSLFQKRYLTKNQFDTISLSLGISSILMYIIMTHGKEFTILF